MMLTEIRYPPRIVPKMYLSNCKYGEKSDGGIYPLGTWGHIAGAHEGKTFTAFYEPKCSCHKESSDDQSSG